MSNQGHAIKLASYLGFSKGLQSPFPYIIQCSLFLYTKSVFQSISPLNLLRYHQLLRQACPTALALRTNLRYPPQIFNPNQPLIILPLNTTYFIPHSHRHFCQVSYPHSKNPTCPRTTSGHAADAAVPTISRSAPNYAPCARIKSVRDVGLGDLPRCLRYVLGGKATTYLDVGRLWMKAMISLMMRPWCLMIIGKSKLGVDDHGYGQKSREAGDNW